MGQLLGQLGIDWRLLLSQAVNFFLLLLILRLFVYKPLVNVLKERRQKIEEGLAKAKEAEERLHEVDEIGRQKIRVAEDEAVTIFQKAEVKAKDLEAGLMLRVKEKEAAEIRGIEARIKLRKAEADQALDAQAAKLVRSALVRMVEISPEAIDEAMITRALKEVKQGL